MIRYPRLMPRAPRLLRASVARTERLSPSFQRVCVSGPDLADFEWRGLDHWVRLFLPPAPEVPLWLPTVKGRSWYRSYLQIPSEMRPHCSNYSVADYRHTEKGGELDLDVVLHWHQGELGGTVARWAMDATVGSPVGLLDQGVMFNPPNDTSELYLAGDETGLPGLRGILRDLPADSIGAAYLEVPMPEDASELAAPAGVEVNWLTREGGRSTTGKAALAGMREIQPSRESYAYIVGESSLANGGRTVLTKAGLPASRITFSGFWRV